MMYRWRLLHASKMFCNLNLGQMKNFWETEAETVAFSGTGGRPVSFLSWYNYSRFVYRYIAPLWSHLYTVHYWRIPGQVEFVLQLRNVNKMKLIWWKWINLEYLTNWILVLTLGLVFFTKSWQVQQNNGFFCHFGGAA